VQNGAGKKKAPVKKHTRDIDCFDVIGTSFSPMEFLPPAKKYETRLKLAVATLYLHESGNAALTFAAFNFDLIETICINVFFSCGRRLRSRRQMLEQSVCLKQVWGTYLLSRAA